LSKTYRIKAKLRMPSVVFDTTALVAGEQRVQSALQSGFEASVESSVRRLGPALDGAMTSTVWPYRNDTRDIYKTGELRASRVINTSYMNLRAVIEIKYTSDYANITHYGGYIYPYGNKAATPVYLPARPWIRATIIGTNGFAPFNFQSDLTNEVRTAFLNKLG